MQKVKRGDIWLTALDPTVGSEIRKTRPCLIMSPAEMHDHVRTVVVAPMTSASRQARFRIPFAFQGTDGLVLLDQVRAIDKSRLVKHLGSVSVSVLRENLRTLREFYDE